MKKNILIICIVVVLVISGYAYRSKSVFQTEVLVNKVDMGDVVIPITPYKLKSNDTQTYLWKNGRIEKYNDKFYRAFCDTVPAKAIERISKELNFDKSFLELGESLIYYSKQLNYELFLTESKDRMKWKIYFLYDDSFKEVSIEHDGKARIEAYQIENDCIYIFSKKVYKIDLKNFTVNLVIDVEELFGIDSVGDKVFINNNIVVSAINPLREDVSKYYMYNIETDESRIIPEKDRIAGIFPYKDIYIVMCSKRDSFEPFIKYYDKNFKLINEKPINISSEYGNVIFEGYGDSFCLYNNKIYAFMSVASKNVKEIVTIDVDTAEIIYQMEITKYREKGFHLAREGFFKFYNDGLVDLNRF